MPQPAEDVFDIDDGVIDQFADGDGQPSQRHRVDADSEVGHRDDGRHQRQRNRRQADERGAEIPEEQEQNDRDEHAAFEQRALDDCRSPGR